MLHQIFSNKVKLDDKQVYPSVDQNYWFKIIPLSKEFLDDYLTLCIYDRERKLKQATCLSLNIFQKVCDIAFVGFLTVWVTTRMGKFSVVTS